MFNCRRPESSHIYKFYPVWLRTYCSQAASFSSMPSMAIDPGSVRNRPRPSSGGSAFNSHDQPPVPSNARKASSGPAFPLPGVLAGHNQRGPQCVQRRSGGADGTQQGPKGWVHVTQARAQVVGATNNNSKQLDRPYIISKITSFSETGISG